MAASSGEEELKQTNGNRSGTAVADGAVFHALTTLAFYRSCSNASQFQERGKRAPVMNKRLREQPMRGIGCVTDSIDRLPWRFFRVRETNVSLRSRPKGGTMRVQEPTTKTMKISDVKNKLSSLVNEIYRKQTRVLVEKAENPGRRPRFRRRPEPLTATRSRLGAGTRALERFSEAFADVPVDELEARIAQTIAEGRAKDAAERRSA